MLQSTKSALKPGDIKNFITRDGRPVLGIWCGRLHFRFSTGSQEYVITGDGKVIAADAFISYKAVRLSAEVRSALEKIGDAYIKPLTTDTGMPEDSIWLAQEAVRTFFESQKKQLSQKEYIAYIEKKITPVIDQINAKYAVKDNSKAGTAKYEPLVSISSCTGSPAVLVAASREIVIESPANYNKWPFIFEAHFGDMMINKQKEGYKETLAEYNKTNAPVYKTGRNVVNTAYLDTAENIPETLVHIHDIGIIEPAPQRLTQESADKLCAEFFSVVHRRYKKAS